MMSITMNTWKGLAARIKYFWMIVGNQFANTWIRMEPSGLGKYDLVPILDRFVEEHPDFSYRGAKAILALTGYNGVLGYRTDETYDPASPNYDQT